MIVRGLYAATRGSELIAWSIEGFRVIEAQRWLSR